MADAAQLPTNPQEAMALAGTPNAMHAGLARFAGRWKADVKFWFDPSAPPAESTGVMVNTMELDGRFLRQDYRADSGMIQGQGYWGYNTVDQRFEGLWIDTRCTFFQLEQGRHDAATDTYHMAGSFTDPMTRRPLRKRSEIHYVAADEHVIAMFMEDGGRDLKMMEIRYTRMQ